MATRVESIHLGLENVAFQMNQNVDPRKIGGGRINKQAKKRKQKRNQNVDRRQNRKREKKIIKQRKKEKDLSFLVIYFAFSDRIIKSSSDKDFRILCKRSFSNSWRQQLLKKWTG